MASLESLESKLAAFGLADDDVSAAPPAPAAANPAPSVAAPKKTASTKKKKMIKRRVRRSPGANASASPSAGGGGDRFTQLYEAGKKQLARQKKIRASKPEGCTFNPKTNRRKSSSGSPVAASSGSPSARSSSRFDKLYLEAKQSKAKLERRRTQQKLKPTGCTFNPRTNADRKKKQNETGASASSASSSRSSRFQSLYADAAKTKAKIARERARRAASAGTFKPKITRKAQRAASPSPAARFERLYQDGRRDLQVQRAKQRADREMRDCTFSPRINKRSSTRSSSARRSRNSGSGSKKESFEDRLLAYGKRTEARLERKRMEAQNEGEMAQCTFTPKVNKNTTSFMRRRPSETAEEVSLRLSQVESKEQFERRMERRRRQLEEQKGATFKPRTSSNRRRSTSARRSRDDDSSDNRGSIWERLNTDRHTLEKRNQRLREERERRELAKCTFQPNAARAKNTTPKQRKGTKKKAAPAGSADQKQQQDEDERVVGASPRALGAIPVWERLSGVNMSAVKIQRDEQKKKLEMAECTFQPKLAKPKSQAQNSVRRENDGDAGTPIWERLYAGRKDMEQIERLAAEHELAACTFAPHISEESEHMASPDWKKEHTPIWTRLYADAMEEQKKETENERVRKELELHGCTFAPNIHIGDEVEEEEEEEATRQFIGSEGSDTTLQGASSGGYAAQYEASKHSAKKKKKSAGGGGGGGGSTKKKKRVVRRKPSASKAIKEMKQKKKKVLARGAAGAVDDADVVFVPKGKGHSRDRKSSVEVDAPRELPPPEGPPAQEEATVDAALGATLSNAVGKSSPNVLRLDILSCFDLREADGAGNKSDPYVKIKMGKKKGRTRTVKNHLHPIFNERFEFRGEKALAALNLEVFDKDLMSDDRLGNIAPLDLSGVTGLTEGRRVKMVLPLVGKKAKQGSTVTIALEWFYSADVEAADGKKKKKRGQSKGKETVKPTPIPQDQAEVEFADASASKKATLKPKAGLSESSDEWDGDDLRKNTNPFEDMVGDAGAGDAKSAKGKAQSSSGDDKTQGRILAEALFLLLDADHSDKLEKKEFRKQLRAKEEEPAVQALYASAGIVDHHASGKQVKRLFDAIDAQHMTMDGDGKRFIDLSELTAFCEKKGAHMV